MAQNEKFIKALRAHVNQFYFPFGNNKNRSHERIGPHNIDVIYVQVGNLLGDGHGEQRNKLGGVRFSLHMSQKNREYLNWLHQFFAKRGYCNKNSIKYKKQIGLNNKIYFSGKFNTWTFNSLIWLYDLFYYSSLDTNKKIKRIPLCISDYQTPLAIAIWFKDDGSKYNKGICFHTNCFKQEDLKILQKAFWNLYKIRINIRQTTLISNQYILIINKNYMYKFINQIDPYILPSKRYKLPI